MLHIAAAIDPIATRAFVDHQLDAAEEELFEALHGQWLDGQAHVGITDDDRPRVADLRGRVAFFTGHDHRPLRHVDDAVLKRDAAAGCREAGDELALRAAGAARHDPMAAPAAARR